jgi:hypothetical protein
MSRREIQQCGSGHGQAADPVENDDENSLSMKCGEFLEQICN